ncbi:ABC transporter ATP-binding protein [Cellvibrio japonicus]|uniref:ABC transporter, ATP-binding protein n=1 Tax=Cellvibrio japonicus (strain Ueda107) TaxID=498211 RepID=B3PE99_CELJU|nr:ATP-binding cassette domain-containing protein [Cellvibrio japonicus]ACE85999.1 ABC transporter, ATP-binding protein [Cellvibrio japonicus Ueda107]QEI12139.1 ATP-binding cassette domain-containing protein [Cellvibrio japonicus]QEI15713.1 ATP-binding cassette domain-containing protein [Cellvibrio japonicus]QEI19291.1 ATP-binding cassette domain-containing protein [Cellvibrio japonicus]
MGTPFIQVRDLSIGYGNRVVQHSLNFEVRKNDIFFIIGGSGCGKTTLLKHMIGLLAPSKGEVLYEGTNFYQADESVQLSLLKKWGITYQSGALFSSMTLAENVALPLQLYTHLCEKEIADAVAYKLALVGLAGFEDFYPAEISGGMHKRAGLARALALDPKLLFFDEPSAGLDPISSLRLDQLILQICSALDSTVIIVSHELPSILSIGTNCVFLDAQAKTMLDTGDPKRLVEHSRNDKVRQFLSRAGTANLNT